MPDQFTVRSHNSFGSNGVNSLLGALCGFLLFVVSFGVLYWNEGRVDFSKYASNAKVVSADVVDQTQNGKLVSTTGVTKTNALIGDKFLKPGPYLSVQRKVEMYSWREHSETKTTNNNGGSSDRATTYTYKKEWSPYPQKSENFNYPEGHQNPPLLIKEAGERSRGATLGAYGLNVNELQLRSGDYQAIAVSADKAILEPGMKIDSGYIYQGAGVLANPQIGDVRISYRVLPLDQEYTIFGKLENGKIVSYQLPKDKGVLNHLVLGSHDSALVKMHGDYTSSLWIWRAVGFAMMFMGMLMIMAPLKAVAYVVPIFGNLTSGVSFAVALLGSLVLSGGTILISMLVRSIWVVVLLVVVMAVAMKKVYKKQN